MEDFKVMLGEELFGQVAEKIGDKKVLIDDGNFIPHSRFNEVVEQKNTYKTQNEELNRQLEEIKSQAKGNDELTNQIQELQNKLVESESKNKEISLNAAIKLEVIKANVKDADVVTMLIDKSQIEMGENGALGLKEQLEAIKENKPYLFESEKIVDDMGGSAGNNPRKNNPPKVTKEEFLQMSYSERVKLSVEEPELYKELAK